ncbi:MAG: 3-hydroxyacyl-ACP dehydratase FabZ family protein [Verrucomicrobiota bacterium]|nr:3-hydroxyacyl-ACP dehydratase FabZ family protein [Verrucomicrobiota bacterium]
MSLSSALTFLPHGPGFRFISELLELIPGQSAKAIYTVRGDEAFLASHFPGDPILPGVILVEAMAQLSGIIAQSDPGIKPLPGLKLSAIRLAKILGSARPGETVHLEATISGRMNHLIQADAKALVDGTLIAQASLVLSGQIEVC